MKQTQLAKVCSTRTHACAHDNHTMITGHALMPFAHLLRTTYYTSSAHFTPLLPPRQHTPTTLALSIVPICINFVRCDAASTKSCSNERQSCGCGQRVPSNTQRYQPETNRVLHSNHACLVNSKSCVIIVVTVLLLLLSLLVQLSHFPCELSLNFP